MQSVSTTCPLNLKGKGNNKTQIKIKKANSFLANAREFFPNNTRNPTDNDSNSKPQQKDRQGAASNKLLGWVRWGGGLKSVLFFPFVIELICSLRSVTRTERILCVISSCGN